MSEPLDDELMFRLFGQDPDKLARIGRLFLAQHDQLFERLDFAIVSKQPAEIASLLHSIKGMAALIGADEANISIARLEVILDKAEAMAIPQVEGLAGLKVALAPYRTWFSRWAAVPT